MFRLILFAAVLLSASCGTCDRYAKNYVIDKDTRQPIYQVQVVSVAATDGRQELEKYYYTDSAGGFQATFTKHNVTQCPVMKLTLTKAGYYPLRVWDPEVGDTLVMQKQN